MIRSNAQEKTKRRSRTASSKRDDRLSKSISTHALPPSRHPAAYTRSRTHFSRREPNSRSSLLQLALATHIHLQHHDAQEIRILTDLPLSHAIRTHKRPSSFRIRIRTALSRRRTASSTAVVSLHLDDGRVFNELGKEWSVQCLLEGSFLLFECEGHGVEIAPFGQRGRPRDGGPDFGAQAWEEEGMRPERIVDGRRSESGHGLCGTCPPK